MSDSERSENDQYTITYNEGTVKKGDFVNALKIHPHI